MYSLLEKDEITKYPVQVCLRGLGEVKVNDHINSLDVNSSGKQICNKVRHHKIGHKWRVLRVYYIMEDQQDFPSQQKIIIFPKISENI